MMSQRYPLVGVHFYEPGSYNVLSVDSGGMAVLWEASLKPDELILKEAVKEEQSEEAPQEAKLTYKKISRWGCLGLLDVIT